MKVVAEVAIYDPIRREGFMKPPSVMDGAVGEVGGRSDFTPGMFAECWRGPNEAHSECLEGESRQR